MTQPPVLSSPLDPLPGSDIRDPPARAALAASLHVPALDGVRGVAILLVLVYHLALFCVARPFVLPGKLLYKLALSGWIGVDLFFVLSGFLITGILYDAKRGDHYFRNFYARRCLRIFPLYFAVLAVVLGLLPQLFSSHGGLLALRGESAWYWTYTTNVMVALQGWPKFGALGHFWSLAVEEQFYLIWPFIILPLSRRRLLAVCAACLVFSLGVRTGLNGLGYHAAAAVLMPARMDALAAGAAVALIGRGPGGLMPFRPWAWLVASVSGASLGAMAMAQRGFDAAGLVLTVGFTLLATLFASLLLLLLSAKRTSRVAGLFRSAGLRFFGRYSYALYVFHHPLLFITTPAAVAAALPWLPPGELAPRLMLMAGVSVVSVVLSVLSWHLFERHFLRIKDWFPYGGRAGAGPQGVLARDSRLPA